MKFEKYYRKIMTSLVNEAGELPPMPEGPEGGDEGGLNLPDLTELEGDGFGGEETGQDIKPEEYELAKLTIKTLEAAGGLHLNPKVFQDHEEGKNFYSILNYIEKEVNKSSGSEEYDNPKFYEKLGIKSLNGMNIAQKMKFFQNSSLPAELQLDGQRRQSWVRIILNAARYGYRDFAIDFEVDKMKKVDLESLYQQLAVDLTFDTRGSDYDIPDKL